MLDHDEFLELANADAERSMGRADPGIRHEIGTGAAFVASWVLGGHADDTPWGEGHALVAEPEDDLMELRELLDDLGVRLRGVNEILRMAGTGRYTSHGEVGNHTRHAYSYVTVAALGAKLVEMGIVEPAPTVGMAP